MDTLWVQPKIQVIVIFTQGLKVTREVPIWQKEMHRSNKHTSCFLKYILNYSSLHTHPL